MNILFVCSANRLRSPTAEAVFDGHHGIAARSAGTNSDAPWPIEPDLIEWADMIFVMEHYHLSIVRRRFHAHLKDKKPICLDIPDDYDYMDPALVQLLHRKVDRLIGIRPIDLA